MTADYTYDILDRLTNVSFDSGAATVSYTYDANGNMLSETVNGTVTEFAYNTAGLLKNQTNQGGSSLGRGDVNIAPELLTKEILKEDKLCLIKENI